MSTSTPCRQSPNPYSTTPKAAPPSHSLSTLLAQANSLNRSENVADLPQLRYGLDEITRRSKDVANKGTRGKQNRAEGLSLLTDLGINTSQLSRPFQDAGIQQSEAGTFTNRPKRRRHVARTEPLDDLSQGYALPDGDISAWGRNWHEMVILSGIEQSRQRTVKAFEDQFQKRMLDNWEAEKDKIMQGELGVTEDEIINLGSSSRLGNSTPGSSTRRFPMASSSWSGESKEGDMVLHQKQLRYMRVVEELNSKRLKKQPFEICRAFEEVVKGDSKYPQLATSYNILSHLTHEPSQQETDSSSSSVPIQERQYASAYLGDVNSNQAILLRGRLVNGAKRYLEKDFIRHMDDQIAKKPREAALGGKPGIQNKVRAFVDVTLGSRDSKDKESLKPELVNSKYIFARVYYLLRSGHPKEASELLSDHANHLKPEDGSLPGALRAYSTSPSTLLPNAQRMNLSNDYNSSVRSNPNVDQFKFAIYKLVGRFELSKRNLKVATTTEDWQWVQMALIREGAVGEGAGGGGGGVEEFGLDDFARAVDKFDRGRYDDGGQKPLVWFNLLLLSGQFEKAIEYLYLKTPLRTDAIHFAIALQYYGLLRLPPTTETDLLTSTEISGQEVYQFNFPRAIKTYISTFVHQEPQSALQYAYLIALASDAPDGLGDKEKTICLEMVRDVVLASRSWGKLLGSVKSDGSKEIGTIERDLSLLKLSDSTEYLRHIVLSAADQSALDSSLTDSLELYHLAGSFDKVVETINRSLGHSLSSSAQTGEKIGSTLGVGSAFGGVGEDVYALGERVWGLYNGDYVKRGRVPRVAWDTLGMVLKLKKGLGEFEAGRPDLALDTFRETGLLPLDGNPLSIPTSTSTFKLLLDQSAISSLDEIVITAMKCLHQLSQGLKNNIYDGDKGRMDNISRYKECARCLVQFASGLRLRLGGDVYRQLSSMSAFF